MNDRAVSASLALAGPDEGEDLRRSRTWLWLFVLFVAVAVAALLLGSATPALASGSNRSVSSSDDDDGDDDDDDSSGGSSGSDDDDSVRAAQTHGSGGSGSQSVRQQSHSGSASVQAQSKSGSSNGHSKSKSGASNGHSKSKSGSSNGHSKSKSGASNGHGAKSDSETSEVDKTHTVVSPTLTTRSAPSAPTRTRPSTVDATQKTKDRVLPKPPLTNPVLPRPDIRPRVEAGILPVTGGDTPWWAVQVGFSLIALGAASLFLYRSIALAGGPIPPTRRRRRYRSRSKRSSRGPP